MVVKQKASKMESTEHLQPAVQPEESSVMNVNERKRKVVTNDTSTKKKPKFKKDLYKQPTVEELNELRETENLFQSNLMRLQIEELLNSVKIKEKYKSLFIKSWFEPFVKQLKIIECNKVFDLNDDEMFKNCDTKIPLNNTINDYKGNFKFLPPSQVKICGSYALNTIIGPESSIDILLEMPESIFQKIDAKNYGYMRKKAMYLAYIGHKLDQELSEKICFVGNNLNPVLKIVPKGKLSEKFVIYIHAVVQKTAFKLSTFSPEKNNVRPSWFFKNSDHNNDVNPPTPHYNSAVIRDLTALETNTQNIEMVEKYPNIRDGIILLKIWLRQREFLNNFESINGHIITMYVLYLLMKKELNTFMSSYQIVRNTWKNLVNTDWCREGISLCKDENSQNQINKYHEHYDCVFLDYTGICNLTANVLEDTFSWISNQAKMSIECLNNTRINAFQILFMQKVPFYRSFDSVICLHNVRAIENILNINLSFKDKLNYGSDKYEPAVRLILRILKQGLGNRISMICVFPRKFDEWELNSEIPNDLKKFYIGLQFDPSTSFNIIEKGPGANLAEAGAFRKFWGDKSELRRFKDGTICETIVWAKENATLAQRREVPLKITKFLLEEKLKLFDKTHYFFFFNQVEEFLKLKKIKVTKFNYGPEEATLQVINVFDTLEKELSNLNDIPLSINGVQGTSPVFRYAEVFPTLSSVNMPDNVNTVAGETHLQISDSSLVEVPRYLAPIEGVLQLSTSGKWPEDLKAFRVLKAEFYLQIAACMRNQYKLRSHATMNHIDIMKDGFVFRFRIANQKEIGLVKQIVEDGVTMYRDNEESANLEKNMFYLPRVTGALYGLHCQQPSFGPACCLVKRWLSAQLIDDSHIPNIVVELLMASMYLNSDPYKPAQTPQIAFLRFLESFARDHWSTDPIIVNFNNEMTREEILEVENFFGSSRDSLPPLFISTPYDKDTSAWTKSAPSFIILHRISALAKEALKLIETQLFSSTNVCFDPLYIPPLSAYDCIIQLKTSLLARKFEAILDDPSTIKLNLHPFKEHSEAKIPIVGFDPVADYLRSLRCNYGDYSLFFHDTYGGKVIGVLIKPNVFSEIQEKEFKNPKTACQKVNKNNKLVFNVSKMIDDFYTLGRGLIETIDIQSEKIKLVL